MGADWRESGEAGVEELQVAYKDRMRNDEPVESDDKDLRFAFFGILPLGLGAARSTRHGPGRYFLSYTSLFW